MTVLHVPPDEKVKEIFIFDLFWIDGKWEIRKFYVDDDALRSQGISDDAIDLFDYNGGWQYHPLPFETDAGIISCILMTWMGKSEGQ